MGNDEVLKLRNVATLLKISEKTIYAMPQTGELPAFKVRGQWRFSSNNIAFELSDKNAQTAISA
jgi:excisionase family DNA binding protein